MTSKVVGIATTPDPLPDRPHHVFVVLEDGSVYERRGQFGWQQLPPVPRHRGAQPTRAARRGAGPLGWGGRSRGSPRSSTRITKRHIAVARMKLIAAGDFAQAEDSEELDREADPRAAGAPSFRPTPSEMTRAALEGMP